MSDNVVKFPYGVSRRAHSRKPRRSKNCTPEERAAKAEPRPKDEGPSITEFLQALKALLAAEFDAGRNLDQVFDDLEQSTKRTEVALERFKANRRSARALNPTDDKT